MDIHDSADNATTCNNASATSCCDMPQDSDIIPERGSVLGGGNVVPGVPAWVESAGASRRCVSRATFVLLALQALLSSNCDIHRHHPHTASSA